jgi:hypothetical protein
MSALDDLALAFVEADAARREAERMAYKLRQATLVIGPYAARIARPGERPFMREDAIVDEEAGPNQYRRRIVTADIVVRVAPGSMLPQAAALELVARVDARRRS